MSDPINGRSAEKILFNIRECAYGACLSECPHDSSDECMEDLLKDALALIKRLEAERDAALTKWISVEERLPQSENEKADCYLVTDGDFIWMAYYASKEWQFAQCTDSPYVIDWTDITHWMPLPELPKEDAHCAFGEREEGD